MFSTVIISVGNRAADGVSSEEVVEWHEQKVRAVQQHVMDMEKVHGDSGGTSSAESSSGTWVQSWVASGARCWDRLRRRHRGVVGHQSQRYRRRAADWACQGLVRRRRKALIPYGSLLGLRDG